MTRDEIRQALSEALSEIQRESGRPESIMSDSLRPLNDMEGFDSLNAEEAAAMLSERLGVEIENNPFVSPKGKPLRMDEIVDELARLLPAKKGA